MKLNYGQIIEEAKRKQISVYLLVKRKIGYRRTDHTDELYSKSCLNCKLVLKCPYTNKNYLCDFIGVNTDKEAIVDDKHICKIYKRK